MPTSLNLTGLRHFSMLPYFIMSPPHAHSTKAPPMRLGVVTNWTYCDFMCLAAVHSCTSQTNCMTSLQQSHSYGRSLAMPVSERHTALCTGPHAVSLNLATSSSMKGGPPDIMSI